MNAHDQACISVGTAQTSRHLLCFVWWCWVSVTTLLFPDWEGLTLGANMCIFAFAYLSLSLFPSTLLLLSEFLACISTLSASLFYASYVLDPCLKSEVCLFLLFFFLRVMFYLAGVFRTSSPRDSISSNPERTALREAASLYRSLATKGRWSERQRIIVN